MDYLVDDILKYLIEIIIDDNILNSKLFSTCTKIKLISESLTNDILKTRYGIIIKDKHLNFPSRSHYHLYKIYGRNFIIDDDKLQELTCLIIFDNNIELIEIINESIPNMMKTCKEGIAFYYKMNVTRLWNLYITSSGCESSGPKYFLRNSDQNFLKFRELIKTFLNL